MRFDVMASQICKDYYPQKVSFATVHSGEKILETSVAIILLRRWQRLFCAPILRPVVYKIDILCNFSAPIRAVFRIREAT